MAAARRGEKIKQGGSLLPPMVVVSCNHELPTYCKSSHAMIASFVPAPTIWCNCPLHRSSTRAHRAAVDRPQLHPRACGRCGLDGAQSARSHEHPSSVGGGRCTPQCYGAPLFPAGTPAFSSRAGGHGSCPAPTPLSFLIITYMGLAHMPLLHPMLLCGDSNSQAPLPDTCTDFEMVPKTLHDITLTKLQGSCSCKAEPAVSVCVLSICRH